MGSEMCIRDSQRADNQSLVGALGWLATQSRPDLQVGVSMCQQLQKAPRVSDLKFTNVLARRAVQHKDCGVTLVGIPSDEQIIVTYHDAGWANAPQDPADPHYSLDSDDEKAGHIDCGPFKDGGRKPKRATSSIASQLGTITFLTSRKLLQGHPQRLSLWDWRSHACARVCRSTFAAETMGCAEALEASQYLRAFYETLTTGKLVRLEHGALEIKLVTDCRSLYDHLTREGMPRGPQDRRLGIDLAAIKQEMRREGKKLGLFWTPTLEQLADILTKPKRAEDWWHRVGNPTLVAFRERDDFEPVKNQFTGRLA